MSKRSKSIIDSFSLEMTAQQIKSARTEYDRLRDKRAAYIAIQPRPLHGDFHIAILSPAFAKRMQALIQKERQRDEKRV